MRTLVPVPDRYANVPPIHSTFGGGSPDTRRTDPATSHEARDSTNAQASIGAVLETLRENGPMTDQQLVLQMEVAAAWSRVPEFSESRIRTARHALVDAGLVQYAGYTRKTASGRNAQVWEVAE